MKTLKIVGFILFLFTLISPIASFALVCIFGEVDVFGVLGMVRYSWIMLLFIPLGLLSILVGYQLKKNNQKYKKNFIVVIACVWLLLFGSFRLIAKDDISYNVERVPAIANEIKIELPASVKIATMKANDHNLSYVKITDDASRINFENEIQTNPLWQSELDGQIMKLFLSQTNILLELENFEKFLFYNSSGNTYNTYPVADESKCIFIAYDYELQRLLILDDWVVKI